MVDAEVACRPEAAPAVAAADRGSGEPLTAALKALTLLDSEQLRAEWRRLYRVVAPPRVRRDLLLQGVAWKLQEKALGGLSAPARRRLAGLARSIAKAGEPTPSRAVRLKPGARLIRTWRGETHSVLVGEDGFAWRGRRFRSLSKIAREITGTRWSGPRFFGLEKPAKPGGRTEEASDVQDRR